MVRSGAARALASTSRECVRAQQSNLTLCESVDYLVALLLAMTRCFVAGSVRSGTLPHR
jgi:hypothetical protein